jgi:hypothetical protein
MNEEVKAFFVANAKKGNEAMRLKYTAEQRREWARKGGRKGKGIKKPRLSF